MSKQNVDTLAIALRRNLQRHFVDSTCT